MDTFRSVSVEEVAAWLEAHGADRMWTVDGETRLGRTVALPCSGSELAAAFRDLGGTVTLVGRDVAQGAGIDSFLFDDDGARAFAMTWSAYGQDDIWVLTEDLIAEAALREANESHVAC